MTRDRALKPCPFCGGEGQIEENGIGDYFVACIGCNAGTSDVRCESQEHAAERWNLRSLDKELDRLVELSEKATQGEWMIYDSNSWRRFGLRGDYKAFLYPARAMDGQADMGGPNRDNDLAFIIAAVNWFRANLPDIRRMR